MTHFKIYPFTAIVGQDLMKLALLLNAVNPKIGGVLIKGTKGTAKSTAVRALADLLPEIKVIKNCSYNCNPDNLKESCHSCQHRIMDKEIKDSDIEFRHMRVINLPINATEDRVVGTVNIEKALSSGLKALEPGILADAHRNILYIDEINLLSDNVADVLLDAAAMGINIIEREGISIHHPSSFIIIGTMNPEEGNLRPQLLDRFGLSVNVAKINDIDKRVKIIKYSEEYHDEPQKFHNKFEKLQEEMRDKIVLARKLLPKVTTSDSLLKKIAEICINFETDGHRADIAINLTAKTIAAFDGRTSVNLEDIKTASKLALPHRLRRLPFEDDNLDEEKLDDILDEDENPQDSQESIENNEKNEESTPPEDLELDVDKIVNNREEVFDIKQNMDSNDFIKKDKSRKKMNSNGRRIIHPTETSKGKFVGASKKNEINIPRFSDIAVSETINTAALNIDNKGNILNGKSMKINESDICIKKREGKSSYLIIFCIDASGSMGVDERMKDVKGAIFSVLHQSYVNRDKVCLIVFRQDKAEIILPPTRSSDLAYKMLKIIPTGGTTPLAAGLLKSLDVAKEEINKKTGYIPLILVLTDARGNIFFKDSIKDISNIGNEIARLEIEMIVIDTENSEVKLELSKKLAEASNATLYHIDDLGSGKITEVLEKEGLLKEKKVMV